jgi:hypothetical protein
MRGSASKSPSTYLVLAAAALILLSSLLFLAARVILPGDGRAILLEELPESAQALAARGSNGLAVESLIDESSLAEGDIVIGVEGRSLDDWLAGLFTGLMQTPNLESGQILKYTLLREGKEMEVKVQLGPYPLGQELGRRWSLYFFLLYLAVVSIVVFVRRPDLPAAKMFLLVSSAVFASGLIFFLGLQISDLMRPIQIGLWLWGSIILYGLLTAGLLHFVFVFPRPSINPKHRSLILLAIYGGVWLPYLGLVLPVLLDHPSPVQTLHHLARSTAIMTLIYFPLILIASAARYRKTESPIERRQMRWILWALVIANVPWLLLSAVPAILGGASQITSNLTGLLWCLIPTAFAVSILREGLFDIDVIIRRTLVYTILTVMLGAIYLGSVILLQSLFEAVSGQQSPVAIVVSTLIIAALFQPLRGRIQGWIDRRFFRRKYDAARTLARFSERARDAVELEQLIADLIQVVDETMRPDQVMLWLPNPDKPKLRTGVDDQDKLAGVRSKLEEKHA